MENTKAAAQLALTFLLLATSSSFAQDQGRPNTPTAQYLSAEQKVDIGNSLYRNANNKLFLKVKNFPLLHPSEIDKPPDEHLYLDMVYIEKQQKPVPLQQIIDANTFRRVNACGSYFIDSAYVYIYVTNPSPVPFFALPRGGEKFLDSKNDFLLHRGRLYFQGVVIDDADITRLKVLKYLKKDKSAFYEFVTDQKHIYGSASTLDLDRLQSYDLSEKDKREIALRFSLK
jgi:hypothetical protein